jgi:signal transduction histidine kinase
MKNKIALRLTAYFSVVLLLSSLVIGLVFITVFRDHTMELYKSDMEQRALNIAATLSEYMNAGTSHGRQQGGYGTYIQFLDDIAMADVWIVDENLEFITAGRGGNTAYNYEDLPTDAEAVVKEVFLGNTTFSEGFSSLLKTPTLTVGTPVYTDGLVTGALLLHSEVEGINSAIAEGIWIMVLSVLSALVLAVLLSILFAVSFTKPLNKMKTSALNLAGGDYSIKTGISRKDEIGDLASAIDVLSVRLNEASLESERMNKMRQDFVSNVSHELRTPVTVIRGSAEALCDGVVTEPEMVDKYHHQILNDCMILQRLVDDLLDLSRLQNTDFKMEMQRISLCDVVTDAVHSASHIAKQKDITVTYENNEGICSAVGDYGRLRQMFLIVLDNAIKFTGSNGHIDVRINNRTVSVKDNGCGISQTDMPYIFDRFYKTDSEGNAGGTGLGLAIAKQIADRHGISISARSEQGKGTEFIFVFPESEEEKK